MSNDDYVTLFALAAAALLLLWPRSSRITVNTAPPGCRFCGDTITISSRSACVECCQRQKRQGQQLERKTRLEIQLIEQQYAQLLGKPNDARGTRD
jgi:Fe-S-cluster-containing dehydrogenase component